MTVIGLLANYGIEVNKAVKQEVLARKNALPRDIGRMLQ